LAAQRGAPVEEVPGLAYNWAGLIHPDSPSAVGISPSEFDL
jgi:hypothetical protein